MQNAKLKVLFYILHFTFCIFFPPLREIFESAVTFFLIGRLICIPVEKSNKNQNQLKKNYYERQIHHHPDPHRGIVKKKIKVSNQL
jgi:hypothetical protein